MQKNHNPDISITGIGITSNIGQGKENFFNALVDGKSRFSILNRPGRQIEEYTFLGAEISDVEYPDKFERRLLRSASLSSIIGLVTLKEAWDEALLDQCDPERIGLVVGGSNFQQRHIVELHKKYQSKAKFLNPTYGFSFFDSDTSALCSEYFGIKGLAQTVGGASASGQLAIIEALKALQTDQVDICIVLGALMDLSFWELQGFKAIGAMGSEKYKDSPVKACRPYDADRDGFIFGENCGVIVLEKGRRDNVKNYAKVTGWALALDGNRNPNPSYEGELQVINQALLRAGWESSQIEYINPHGTGSPLGDETELKALKDARLTHAYINSTKSVIGHGLTAAGTVEVIAALLQMEKSILHPCLNLDDPIDTSFNWVKEKTIKQDITKVLSLSMGFGGINTALCLEK